VSDFLYTPTGRFLGQWASGSREWHAARAKRLGGSRMAALLGLSPWESPYSAWCEMAGLVAPESQTDEQARGHYLEPAIASWFADQHPEWHVFETGTWTHRSRDWQLTNPDRLIREQPLPGVLPVGWYDLEVSSLLEIKTDADGTGWGKPGTDEIPVYYRTQVQWYLDALGLQRAYIAVLTSRLQFREYVVEFDPVDAQMLRDRAEEFLDSLLWGEMPELDDHPATYRAVRKLHPDIEDVDVDVDPELAAEFVAAQRDKAAGEARVVRARTALAAAMGTARRAVCGPHTIATRQSKSGGTPHVVAGRNLPDPTTLIGAAA